MNKAAIIFLSLIIGQAYADSRDVIEKRIKPIGQVRIEGQVPKIEKAVVAEEKSIKEDKAVKVAARDGKAVYSKACAICHAAGVAGAPKLKDKASWGARTKKSMDVLLASVKKGKGAMPPMGMCMDCSDKELEAAIKHMLPS